MRVWTDRVKLILEAAFYKSMELRAKLGFGGFFDFEALVIYRVLVGFNVDP